MSGCGRGLKCVLVLLKVASALNGYGESGVSILYKWCQHCLVLVKVVSAWNGSGESGVSTLQSGFSVVWFWGKWC